MLGKFLRTHGTALAVLLTTTCLVYFPGINGPWVFDDHASLLGNSFIKITHFDWEAIWRASWSFDGSPLHRPVAMFSFALNHWLAGGFQTTLPFKTVNITIHAINSILIYFLFLRLATISEAGNNRNSTTGSRLKWYAFVIALVWAIHPIQLTSVLYVIQRMTSLSATFTLLALLSYVCARIQSQQKRWALYAVSTVFLGLSILSKENGVLTLLFVFLIELMVLKDHPWLLKWEQLPTKSRHLSIIALTILAIAIFVAFTIWGSPNYAHRPFTLNERLLTEARVVVFYLSLILLPRVNAFGLHHDDISISTSLIAPWTTMPSILLLLALIASAYLLRRRIPFYAFGVFWFFAGHILESTTWPLELVHEHRNYLPSLGILISVVALLRWQFLKSNKRILIASTVMIVLILGSSTVYRSYQWSSVTRLYAFEALHHPDSPILQLELSGVLQHHNKLDAAILAATRASKLAPNDPAFLLNLVLLKSMAGESISNGLINQIDSLLEKQALTTTFNARLNEVDRCLTSSCSSLIPHMERWLSTLLLRTHRPGAKSQYAYLLGRNYIYQGRTQDAVYALWKAHELDRRYLRPLFLLGKIYIESGYREDAKNVIALAERINRRHRFPQRKALSDMRKHFNRRFGTNEKLDNK